MRRPGKTIGNVLPERICAHAPCGAKFTPRFPTQRYHEEACRESAQRSRARTRAREKASSGKLRDEVASVYMDRQATGIERAICDIEREALERRPQTGVFLLESTLGGIIEAHVEGDDALLRGELVQLAAQAVEWSSRLPRPVARRNGRKGVAA